MAAPEGGYLSINEYVSDGSKTEYDLSFAGGYINRTDVGLYVYNTAGAAVSGYSFEWLADYQVSLNAAPPSGYTLSFQRNTDYTAPAHDFTDGAIISETNLDDNAKQAIFLAAELRDRFGSNADVGDMALLLEEAKQAASVLRQADYTFYVEAATSEFTIGEGFSSPKVWVNGVLLMPQDYTVGSTSVTLNEAAQAGDSVLISAGGASPQNTVSAANVAGLGLEIDTRVSEGVSTKVDKSNLPVNVTDAPYNAVGDGVTDDLAAFNAAAATGRAVNIPAGSYYISAATSRALWILQDGATIVGLSDVGDTNTPAVMLNNASRLTGKMVRYSDSQYGPAVEIGDTNPWLEQYIRPSAQSRSTLPVVSDTGQIAITGASKTSDNPGTAGTEMACVGGNFYAINDSTGNQTAYAAYLEARRRPGGGAAFGAEFDIANQDPVVDLGPYSPLSYAKYTGGLILNSGAGLAPSELYPASFGLMFGANGAAFRRGIVFNAGALDTTLSEAVAMNISDRLAWYSGTTLNSYVDHANSYRTVDASGSFSVVDTAVRKGGDGAASPSLGVVHQHNAMGWTGSAVYTGVYTRTLQRSAFSGGNARFSFDIAARNTAGTEAQVSLNGAGDNSFAPMTDNAISLGASGFRWSTVYAGTGTINTSDERLKTWRGGPTAADKRAAQRILGELGWFQFTDKGETGRWHFGIRAQAVARILMDEGIEPVQNINFASDVFVPEDDRPSFKAAFLCFDTWNDQFEDEMTEVEEMEKFFIRDLPTGVLGVDGKPIMKPYYGERPIKRSVATGNQIKVKSAGNQFGIRPDGLVMYMLLALA